MLFIHLQVLKILTFINLDFWKSLCLASFVYFAVERPSPNCALLLRPWLLPRILHKENAKIFTKWMERKMDGLTAAFAAKPSCKILSLMFFSVPRIKTTPPRKNLISWRIGRLPPIRKYLYSMFSLVAWKLRVKFNARSL